MGEARDRWQFVDITDHTFPSGEKPPSPAAFAPSSPAVDCLSLQSPRVDTQPPKGDIRSWAFLGCLGHEGSTLVHGIRKETNPVT